MTSLPSQLSDLPKSPLIHYDQAVVMLGGGDFDGRLYHQLAADLPVIAADCGGDHAFAHGVSPEWVIGDMDSISPKARDAASHHLHITDQFSTDFEKLLACVHAPQIFAFGFLGKRMDHSLASLHAMAKARADMAVVLVDHHDAVVFCRQEFTASLPAGARLSIWPLQRQFFQNSQGLVWPLDQLLIEAGGVLGTSNQVLDPSTDPLSAPSIDQGSDVTVAITPGEGDGYFVITEGRWAERLLASQSSWDEAQSD